VAGHFLTREKVSGWVRRLAGLPFSERLRLKGIDPRRVDVLLAGTLIIERLQAKFGNDSFQVFDRGIRFGKMFDVLRGFVPPIIW
jgi:exopolyphosphatase/guanosine-5'-triphosphate,3'-diphosphate pyrophosphatase